MNWVLLILLKSVTNVQILQMFLCRRWGLGQCAFCGTYTVECLLCSSAVDTQLVDNTFPEDDFEVVLGSLEVKWQRIGPYPLCVNIYSNCLKTFSSNNIGCYMYDAHPGTFCDKGYCVSIFTFFKVFTVSWVVAAITTNAVVIHNDDVKFEHHLWYFCLSVCAVEWWMLSEIHKVPWLFWGPALDVTWCKCNKHNCQLFI